MDTELVAGWQGFQDEVVEWSRRNFGEQSTFAPLVGMLEEIGEFYDAVNGPEESRLVDMQDAIHDAVVYMMDFTGRRGIPMREILLNCKSGCQGFVLYDDFAAPLHKIHGRICHATLKMEQKIRGNEAHREKLVAALADWLRMLQCLISLEGQSFLDDVVGVTWSKVKQRNWKANPATGTAATA